MHDENQRLKKLVKQKEEQLEQISFTLAENESFLDKSNILSKSSLGGDISGESIIHSLPMNTLPAKRKKSMRNLLLKEQPQEMIHFSSEKPERKKKGRSVVVAHSRCETCPNL